MSVCKLLRAIIMGPPGAGKGTISSRIVKDYSITHLSSGDILRSQVSKATPVGLVAQKFMANGDLVSDEIMMKLVTAELKGPHMESASWLLDGFPRTVPQCEGLLSNHTIDVVINLNVPFDEIVYRVKDRFIHEPSGRVYNLVFNPPKSPGVDDITGEPLIQRDDDKEETVRARLQTYQSKSTPVLDFFDERNLLVNFTGRYTNELWPKVFAELSKHIKPLSYTQYQ